MNYRDPQEPVFVVKAKDVLAVPTLRAYQRECFEHGLADQAAEVGKAIGEMIWWQQKHTVKMPDHKHVRHHLVGTM